MRIKEAIELLEVDYNLFPDDGEHYLKGIKALKKQLDVPLIEVYPYNLAFDIFDKDAETKALSLSANRIDATLATLTDRERLVLNYRYKEKLTLEQIAKIIGVTRERIRQIEAKALRKLRHPSRIAKMKAYSYEDVLKNAEERNELKMKNGELERIISKLASNQLSTAELEGLSNKTDIPVIKLEELDLSVRTYNCLKRAGRNDLLDITDMTLDDLKKVRNMGAKSADEVIKKLDSYGLKLKGEEE